MKNKLKSTLSFVTCLAILFSSMTFVTTAFGYPSKACFNEDFSSGTIVKWQPVLDTMNRNECTVSSDGEQPYANTAAFSGDSLVLTPKNDHIKKESGIYNISYTLKSNTANVNESSPLRLYTLYDGANDFSAYEIYQSGESAVVNAVKSVKGKRTVQTSAKLDGFTLTKWFTADITVGHITLTQDGNVKEFYNSLTALNIYISGSKCIFANVTADSIDREKMSFSDSADYFDAIDGSVSSVRITSESDGNVLSFKKDEITLKAKSELVGDASGEAIQTVRMYVKTVAGKPFNIYTVYKNDKNYNYIRISQSKTVCNMTYYSVTDGVKKTEWTKQNIAVSDIDFRNYVLVYINMSEYGKCSVSFFQNGTEELARPKISESVKGITFHAKELILESTYSNSVCYKNVKISTSNTDKFNSIYKECRIFDEKYDELLRVDGQTYIKNYDSVLDSFENDYEALSTAAKYHIFEQKLYVDSLKTLSANAPSAIPEKSDLSDFTDDFENGLSNWVDATENDSDMQIVYDEALNSNVLKLTATSYYEAGATLKSFLNPSSSAIKSINYKVRFDKMATQDQIGPKIIYSYQNKSLYNVFHFFSWEATKTGAPQYRWYQMNNGSNTNIYQTLVNQNKFRLTEWFDVSINYNNEVATVTYTWNKGAEDEVKYTYNCRKANPVGASVMLAALQLGRAWGSAYYDDVKVTYTEFKDDTDVKTNDKLIVYYTGNTAQYPDDIVEITGEDLYENLSYAEISEIPNDTDDNQAGGYIIQMTPEALGKEGKYTQSSVPYFNDSNSEVVSILQPDEDSFKFILPNNFKKGIYALKLHNSNNSDEATVYINRPKVKQIMGDEGRNATPGGTLQLIGENLVLRQNEGFTGGGKVKVQFKNASGTTVFGEGYLNILSAYSLTVDIPEDMAVGEYEVMVYNGFGDGTCWSEPVTVNISRSPREDWSKKVFNINDYGATGELDQNATPVFVNALDDIAKNGGGILYLPRGQYMLMHTLIIPENVLIKGEGDSETVVFWNPDQWAFGNLPDSLIVATSNVEIDSVGFYTTRRHKLFNFVLDPDTSVANKNIYIRNCTMYTNPFTADATDGTLSANRLLNHFELRNLIRAENSGSTIFIGETKQNADNVRIENNWITAAGVAHLDLGYYIKSDYLYFCNNNVDSLGYCMSRTGESLVYMNNEYNLNCQEVTAFGCYSQNNKYKNVVNNNRELIVADHGPEASDVTMISGDKPNTYKLVGKDYGKDIIGYQIYVDSGPNKGSTRIVTDCEGGVVTFDTPLALEATYDTKVDFGIPRQHQYFVDNYFFNGCAGGFFSRCADVIYDNNTFSRVTTQYQQAIFGDCNFYISYVNNTFIDPYALFNYGYAENSMKDWHGPSYIQLYSMFQNKSYAHTFRRNTLDGYQLRIEGASYRSMVNVIVEDNVFSNVDTAIKVKSLSSIYDVGGIMFYKNATVNVETLCNMMSRYETNNYGSKLFEFMKSSVENEGFAIGDVNGDGEITLKDCTVLYYYLAGRLALTSEQLARGDINNSGIVSLKDVASIKNYLLYGDFLTDYDDSDYKSPSSSTGGSRADVSESNSSLIEGGSSDYVSGTW